MKKTITSFFIFCLFSISVYAQFQAVRGTYTLPQHTGILLVSSVLPLGNIKATKLNYNSAENTWTVASQKHL